MKDLITRCVRIIHISRKPTTEEFNQVAKITGLGIVVIGIIGLVMSTILSII